MSAMERVMPLPKLHLREGSLSQSPRSPTRRTPSPLRHAQFRPLAMEYANSPQPSSCKFYNAGDANEEVTMSEFCAQVRTVGYNTVGSKTFMSGRCPHCHRLVKSDKQVCTPNATPPASPWKIALENLQSPLRSPLRSRNTPTNAGSSPTKPPTPSLQSPLRSPFKGTFFGSKDDADASSAKAPTPVPSSPKKAVAGAVAASPTPRGIGLTRSPPRGGGPSSPAVAPWSRSRSPAPRANSPGPRTNSPIPRSKSPGPRSPVRGSSPTPWSNSPSSGAGAFFGANDGGSNSNSGRGSAISPRAERGRSPGPRGADKNPFREVREVDSPARSSRSLSPAHARSPGGAMSRHSPGRSGSTRGPRSPGPHSPARSPWKGASFFGNSQADDGEEVEWGISGGGSSSRTYVAVKSRGAHSPGPVGPRSPLRVKVDFADEQQVAEEEQKRDAAAAMAASPKHAKGGWKSPLRSPFKGLFFGGSSKKGAGGVKIGTE